MWGPPGLFISYRIHVWLHLDTFGLFLNVAKYTIHGPYGFDFGWNDCNFFCWHFCHCQDKRPECFINNFSFESLPGVSLVLTSCDQVMLTWTMKMNWPRPYWPMPNAMWRRTLSEARNGVNGGWICDVWAGGRTLKKWTSAHQTKRWYEDATPQKIHKEDCSLPFSLFLVLGARNFPWISL